MDVINGILSSRFFLGRIEDISGVFSTEAMYGSRSKPTIRLILKNGKEINLPFDYLDGDYTFALYKRDCAFEIIKTGMEGGSKPSIPKFHTQYKYHAQRFIDLFGGADHNPSIYETEAGYEVY